MKNFELYRWILFISIALTANSLQAQTDDINITFVQKYQYKNYEDGTQAGYFTLDGNFTLKDLHRVEQYFIDTEGVLKFAIIDKSAEKGTHTAFISVDNQETSKKWIEIKLNQGLAAQKFSVSWAE